MPGDTRHVVTVGGAGGVAISTHGGRRLLTLRGHGNPAHAIRFLGGGELIVTFGRDGARVWRIHEKIRLAHTDRIFGLCFDDSRRLVTSSMDGWVRIWGFWGSGIRPLHEHDFGKPVYSVAAVSGGEQIIAGLKDGSICVWTPATGEVDRRQLHRGRIWSILIQPTPERQILTCGSHGEAHLWTEDLVHLEDLSQNTSELRFGAWSRDGSRFAIPGMSGSVFLGQGRQLLPVPGLESGYWSVCFDPLGEQLLTGSVTGKTQLWTLDGQTVRTFDDHGVTVDSAVFSADGDHVLTASKDGTTRLWRSSDRKLVFELADTVGQVTRAIFSPDGMWIVTAVGSGLIRYWPASAVELRKTLEGLELRGFTRRELMQYGELFPK